MKDRKAVTCNGRAAFYACIWDDLRQSAMNNGWALGLHGSLNSDMDIMAMPWVENAVPADTMIERLICDCFGDNSLMPMVMEVTRNEKPNGRVVYTLPIFGDFYLDINIIENKEEMK